MNDLAIELKPDTGKCMYQQIYEYIRNEIREGKLQRDEKLPSTRSLAEYLQIARSTVDSAYSQLLAEGYIVSKPCRGYFVSGVEELFDFSGGEEMQKAAGQKAPSDAFSEQFGSEEAKKEDSAVQYDFSPHGISMKYFP